MKKLSGKFGQFVGSAVDIWEATCFERNVFFHSILDNIEKGVLHVDVRNSNDESFGRIWLLWSLVDLGQSTPDNFRARFWACKPDTHALWDELLRITKPLRKGGSFVLPPLLRSAEYMWEELAMVRQAAAGKGSLFALEVEEEVENRASWFMSLRRAWSVGVVL
jgi:hypothetical protein